MRLQCTAAALAAHQLDRQGDLPASGDLSGYQVSQKSHGLLSHCNRGRSNAGERGFYQLRLGDVIETYESDVLGDAQPCVADGFERAQG